MDSTMLRDGLPDDRITCATCTHVDAESNYCKALQIRTVRNVPFRCLTYVPLFTEADHRTGSERWPTLKPTIEEVRKLDREHAKHPRKLTP